MLYQALIVVGLLFTAVCGVPLIEERIYGGSEAKSGQFPYQITLRSWYFNMHHCGGSIISNRHILTAAHCVRRSSPPRHYTVVVGAHSKNAKDGRAYKVARFTQHETYNETSLQHDVALIELETTIEYNERVAAIPLHRGFIGGEVKAVASGWGKTNDAITNLKYTQMYTMSNNECRRRTEGEPDADEVHDFSTLCAYSGRNGTGLCSGDSGGPLVYNHELIGVASWGFLCARGLPDGFARVSEYIDWIEKNMKSK